MHVLRDPPGVAEVRPGRTGSSRCRSSGSRPAPPRPAARAIGELRPKPLGRRLQAVVQQPADRFHVARRHGRLDRRSVERRVRHGQRRGTRRRWPARTAGRPARGGAAAPIGGARPPRRGPYTRRPAGEEEGDVAAERRRQSRSTPRRQAQAPEPVQPDQRRRRVARSAASPASIGMRFVRRIVRPGLASRCAAAAVPRPARPGSPARCTGRGRSRSA